MFSFVESPTFAADADKLWSAEKRLDFFVWLAGHPEAGDVIPGSVVAERCAGRGQAPANEAGLESSSSLAAPMERFGCS